jgi:Gelsolin repeat
MPEERISWKESNLALIGSDLDKKIKQAAAGGEDNWKVIGEAAGVKIWRIEQFKVVPWPEEKKGKFHTGDSYIVLHSWTVPGEDKLNHDFYIWIGRESSQDEYGTAAYKMVEADDYTGGSAVQYREVQGCESTRFTQLFDGPLTYLEGGVESGFMHVEPTEEKPHMFKVKGTENAMSLTQAKLEKASLNKGDSFILVANPSKVWSWHGEGVRLFRDVTGRAVSFGVLKFLVIDVDFRRSFRLSLVSTNWVSIIDFLVALVDCPPTTISSTKSSHIVYSGSHRPTLTKKLVPTAWPKRFVPKGRL